MKKITFTLDIAVAFKFPLFCYICYRLWDTPAVLVMLYILISSISLPTKPLTIGGRQC